MPKSAASLEPQQERSRESLRRLLLAAQEVLGQHGLAGATIPRIARHAGLTAGAVYRRFRNKDVLLETMILRFLEEQYAELQHTMTMEMASQIPLAVLVEQLISAQVLSYRGKAALLRAVRQFVQHRQRTPFWKKAEKIEVRTMVYCIDLLLGSRGEIQHPEPRAAIGFAAAMTVGALWELVVDPPDRKLWQGLIPDDDRTLKRELTRSFLNYLGVESEGG